MFFAYPCDKMKISTRSDKRKVAVMLDNVLVVHGGGPTAVINSLVYGGLSEAMGSGKIGKV